MRTEQDGLETNKIFCLVLAFCTRIYHEHDELEACQRLTQNTGPHSVAHQHLNNRLQFQVWLAQLCIADILYDSQCL